MRSSLFCVSSCSVTPLLWRNYVVKDNPEKIASYNKNVGKLRIVVEDGAMNASKKYRGKIASVVMNYVKDMEKDLKKTRPERVFITHSGCEQETVEKVRAYLKELDIFDEILETRAGGVVSSHCGPGTLGVLYIAK